MKILFILENYYPNIGGVEKLFKELAENLLLNGHDIMIITNRFDSNLLKEETVNGVKIRRLNLRNRFAFTFFSIFRILPYVGKFDIIHTTSYNAALPAWLAAKIYRKPSIITFHEVWGDLWKDLPYINSLQRVLFSFYEWFILQLKVDYYIAISEFTKRELMIHGIPERKIKHIYNGINLKDYQSEIVEKKDKFTFTFYGRLGISKGLDLLIPAARGFIEKHPESIFKCIIPKTPKGLYNKVMTELDKQQFGNNLIVLHHLSFQELKKEILSSDCIMIPSYSEGFCFAAVEATSLGIPIISSQKGALKETVSKKHINMTVHDKAGIILALERAIKNDFDESPEKVFSLEMSIANYLSFYQNLVR